MESSRRAVEAYLRTRLIDQATSDDDKITPVYRLDEISDIIRSSPNDIAHEMLEYSFRRLQHRSPRVKQKTLRLFKFTVGKSGPEFKRELQRQSGAIRQLFHYKGQPDVLRGDSLNKAVRDSAHEAINAIFATDEKPATLEDANNRIQGFGSTNFDMSVEGKKSLLDEVVDFGSASIRQGLSIISGYSNSGNLGSKKTIAGSYRGPSLRKSLTMEQDTFERHNRGILEHSRVSLEVTDSVAGPSTIESQLPRTEAINGRAGLNNGNGASPEEKLLNTITAPGGVRLHPTRDNLQAFLSNALKLDSVSLGHALESKLQAHSWQVRLKALCVLEAILWEKDQKFFGNIAVFFEEDASAIHECLKSPQTSLREKAKKVLDLLGALSKQETEEKAEGASNIPIKDAAVPTVEIPDLIDTRDLNEPRGTDALSTEDSSSWTGTTQPCAIVGDLLGEELWSTTPETTPDTAAEDVFAGVSFHTPKTAGDAAGDLFSNLSIDDSRLPSSGAVGRMGVDQHNLFGGLSIWDAEPILNKISVPSESLADLMGRTFINRPETTNSVSSDGNGNISSLPHTLSPPTSLQANSSQGQTIGTFPYPHMTNINPPLVPPMEMAGAFRPNMMFPQSFSSGVMGVAGMGNVLAQQQLLAGMSGFQNFGPNVGSSGNFEGSTVTARGLVAYGSDGFDFSTNPISRYTMNTEGSKEETKAFDFISGHLSAARGSKKAS